MPRVKLHRPTSPDDRPQAPQDEFEAGLFPEIAPEPAEPEKPKYEVWTCGAMASRLRETTIQKEDGEWILPNAYDVYEDYMESTGDEIRLPKAAIEYIKDHGMNQNSTFVPHFVPHLHSGSSNKNSGVSAKAGS